MVTIYYPSGSKMQERNTVSGSYVVATLNVPSNAIFWFDTSGSISSSIITIDTSSYSMTSSYLSGSVMGSGISNIQSISSANYAALNPPSSTTLYIVTT